jgi:predicted dehydrogenase
MASDATATTTLGVGLIGLGGINRVHAMGYQLTPERAQVVAACDSMEAVANERAAELGVTPYVDYRALLEDDRVDSVDVTLPHYLHYPVVRAALEAGKHVLVEKPFALESAQCRELIDLARDRGLRLAVAENTPFVDAYLATKRLLEEGALGRIYTVRTLIYGSEVQRLREGGWTALRDQAGGGVIIDAGVHSFYLLEWLFGRVRTLHATMGTALPESQVEDYAVVTGELEEGTLFTCELTCVAELPWGERLELYGENGAVVVDQLDDPVARHYRGGLDWEPVPLPGVPYEPRLWKVNSIAAGVADFVNAVCDDRPTVVDPETGLRSVLIAEKAYDSVSAGGVEINV